MASDVITDISFAEYRTHGKQNVSWTYGKMEASSQLSGKHLKAPKSRSAFTLIELLVVIAIISILATILLPNLTRAMELARKTTCMNNLRMMGFAVTMHTNDNEGWLPRPFYDFGWVSGTAPSRLWVDDLAVYDVTAADGNLNCPSEEKPFHLPTIKYGLYNESYNQGYAAYAYNNHYTSNPWAADACMYHLMRSDMMQVPNNALIIAERSTTDPRCNYLNKLFMEPPYSANRHDGQWNALMGDSSVKTLDKVDDWYYTYPYDIRWVD